jgi:tetratricopeptide (TPR) repeat protein
MWRGAPTLRRSLLLGGGTALAAAVVAVVWPQVDSERVWSRANVRFDAGEWDLAESDLAWLAWLRAPDPKDHLLRAKLLIARDRVDEALSALQRVPDSAPMAPIARLVAGQLESKRGRLPSAERHLLAALALDTGLVAARRELIFIYGNQLRRREVDEQFRALSRLTPLSFDDLLVWSLCHTVNWDPKIRVDLERFLTASPDDRWTRLALAEVFRRLRQLDEASSILAPLSDSDPEALYLRAQLAAERLDLIEARRLLARGPTDHAGLARLRGSFALNDRDFAAAADFYRTAVGLDPDDIGGLSGLSRALHLLGDNTAAQALVDRVNRCEQLGKLIEQAGAPATSLDPNLPRLLGAACAAVDRLAEAKGWYQLAIARDPLDTEAQQALFRLTSNMDQGLR